MILEDAVRFATGHPSPVVRQALADEHAAPQADHGTLFEAVAAAAEPDDLLK